LLFDNAKYLLPYTGIGSGIIRAMKSYDHITFKNNYTKEDFTVTIHRQEIRKRVESKTANERIDFVCEGINPENEGINSSFEGINLVNEGIKKELTQIYSFIQKNPLAKHADIQQLVNKSDATIERYIKTLKENGLIRYVGAKRTGGYEVIEKKNNYNK